MLDEVKNEGIPNEVKDDGKPDLLDNPNLGIIIDSLLFSFIFIYLY